jgi:hypothetical protein
VQFQEIILGSEIRVHTIGTAIFATAVHSEALDYRYGHATTGIEADLSETYLQDHVAQQCVNLASRLGLEMAGIDLKIAPNGATYCFEVNPSPAYSYYESATGQPMARTLAQYLAGGIDANRADASRAVYSGESRP